MGLALALAQPKDLVKLDTVFGTGAEAKKGDIVTVAYKGNLLTGKVFDSTEGKPPFSFVLGQGEVIEGWDKGVAGMKVGGKRVLSIPPSLGYKDMAIADIPANSTLIFEVELFRVEKTDKSSKVEMVDTLVGGGDSVVDGKTVRVHYRGSFLNGFVFDESYKRNQPLEVKVGAGQVIKGFEDGLRGMKQGGKRKVTIPYHMAYGDKGRPPVIPAFATLVFELELVEIK